MVFPSERHRARLWSWRGLPSMTKRDNAVGLRWAQSLEAARRRVTKCVEIKIHNSFQTINRNRPRKPFQAISKCLSTTVRFVPGPSGKFYANKWPFQSKWQRQKERFIKMTLIAFGYFRFGTFFSYFFCFSFLFVFFRLWILPAENGEKQQSEGSTKKAWIFFEATTHTFAMN